jgi:hypothetical protein
MSRGVAMSEARVVRRRLKLAKAVERAAVVERPVVCRGPLYLVHPTVTAACGGSLQRIAVLLRDESYPIASSVLGAVEVFIGDGKSPFFGRDAALAQREGALLQRLVESGQRTGRRYGRGSGPRRARSLVQNHPSRTPTPRQASRDGAPSPAPRHPAYGLDSRCSSCLRRSPRWASQARRATRASGPTMTSA